VTERLGCRDETRYRVCDFTFTAPHYRNQDLHLVVEDPPAPQSMYELPVTVWLPLEEGEFGPAPYPTMIFGHGLGSGRSQARRLAHFAAPRGMATIAIPAPSHGEHPAQPPSSDRIEQIMHFFGLAFTGSDFTLDPFQLRDGWRQGAFDKVALTELLANDIDVTGDGSPDLDGSRTTYLGVSLGGIMGPGFLALTDRAGAAVLVVGGGRVTDIVSRSELFEPVLTFLRPPGFDEDDMQRFFVLVQTAIDRGDASNFAAHVTHDRIDGGEPVQVLNAMVLDDDTVPNVTNMVLARALGAPHVAPQLREIGTLQTVDTTPFSGNLADGGTAGTIQFDWIFENDQWERATHDNIGDSTEGAHAWLRFLDTFYTTGTGEVPNAYEELGLDPPR